MVVRNEIRLLNLHRKINLRGRTAELINSRNPNTRQEIIFLLKNRLCDFRDLSLLVHDLQRIKQIPNESPLTFVTRLRTNEANVRVNKQTKLYPSRKERANSFYRINGFNYPFNR